MAVEEKYGATKPLSTLDAKTLDQAKQLGQAVKDASEAKQSVADKFGPNGGGSNEAMKSLQVEKGDRPNLSPDDRFVQRDQKGRER